VQSRRARTRHLGDGDRAAVALEDLVTVEGDGSVVDGESDGGGELNGDVEVDTHWRGLSLFHIQLVDGDSPPKRFEE
jgi:hypothetical protein